MRRKLFGRSGLRVSELCLGTMTFGRPGPRGTPPDECERLFTRFVERGGNFIDTSPEHGNGIAEQIVGRLVAARRPYFVLATRLKPPRERYLVRSRMIDSLDASLRRLGTDHIDLLWLDAWAGSTALDEVMATVEYLVSSGRVLYVGVTSAPARLVAQAAMLSELNGCTPLVGLQFEYSLLERTAEQESMPTAESLGLTMVPWGVLGGGLLAGKYRGEQGSSVLSERAHAVIARVCELARDLERPPSQIALAWVRQQSANLVPIVGARSAEQVDEVLGALDLQLTRAELRRLSRGGFEILAPQYPAEQRVRA